MWRRRAPPAWVRRSTGDARASVTWRSASRGEFGAESYVDRVVRGEHPDGNRIDLFLTGSRAAIRRCSFAAGNSPRIRGEHYVLATGTVPALGTDSSGKVACCMRGCELQGLDQGVEHDAALIEVCAAGPACGRYVLERLRRRYPVAAAGLAHVVVAAVAPRHIIRRSSNSSHSPHFHLAGLAIHDVGAALLLRGLDAVQGGLETLAQVEAGLAT